MKFKTAVILMVLLVCLGLAVAKWETRAEEARQEEISNVIKFGVWPIRVFGYDPDAAIRSAEE